MGQEEWHAGDPRSLRFGADGEVKLVRPEHSHRSEDKIGGDHQVRVKYIEDTGSVSQGLPGSSQGDQRSPNHQPSETSHPPQQEPSRLGAGSCLNSLCPGHLFFLYCHICSFLSVLLNIFGKQMTHPRLPANWLQTRFTQQKV